MPIKFHSKDTPDILMFDDVALRLIKMMGHSGTVPGSIAAEDVPAALQRLEQAVVAAEKLPGRPEPSKNGDEDGPKVSLPHRALPLLDMLRAAAANGAYVMWKK